MTEVLGPRRVLDACISMIQGPLVLFSIHILKVAHRSRNLSQCLFKNVRHKTLQEPDQPPRPSAKTTTAKVRLRVASRSRPTAVHQIAVVTLKQQDDMSRMAPKILIETVHPR